MPIATAEIVSRNFTDKRADLVKNQLLVELKPEHAMLAQKALEWAQNITDEQVAKNDYLYNIRTVARAGSIEPRLMGYAASIIPAYQREVEKQVRREQEAKLSANSQWQGTVGQRLENVQITVLGCRQFDGDYGVTTLVSMVDAAGNRYKWWASGSINWEAGTQMAIKGTVKKHEEYKGTKETVLSRVSEWTPPKPKAKKGKKVAAEQTELPVVSKEGDIDF